MPAVTQLLLKSAFRGPKSDGAVTAVTGGIVGILAICSVVFSGGTIFLTEESTVALVASVMTICFGPVVVYQKSKLAGLGTLRSQHNALRSKVNEFSNENERMRKNVDRLGGTVSKIEEVEANLAELADTGNVNRLVEIVKEQKEILEKMKENLKARVLHSIIDIVIRNDRDGDFMIGPREMDRMVLALEQMEGVDFEETMFRNMLGRKKRYTLGNVMGVLRNMLDDELPEEEKPITLRPENLTRQ